MFLDLLYCNCNENIMSFYILDDVKKFYNNKTVSYEVYA